VIDLFADGVVVWRTYNLCATYLTEKIFLIPVSLLVLTSSMSLFFPSVWYSLTLLLIKVSIFMTIALRIVLEITGTKYTHGAINTCFVVFQTFSTISSLVINVIATAIVVLWALWVHALRMSTIKSLILDCFITVRSQHRRNLFKNLESSSSVNTQVGRVILLLAESGIAYCISSVSALYAFPTHIYSLASSIGYLDSRGGGPDYTYAYRTYP
jgi:hypothetical protein